MAKQQEKIDFKLPSWMLRVGDILDVGIALGVAYYGAQREKAKYGEGARMWEGALKGALGYKLATNTGGAALVPNVSRVAGLALIAELAMPRLLP